MSANADLRLIAGMGPQLFTAPSVAGLPDDLQATLNTLVSTWQARYPGNARRQSYLDCKVFVESLNIALPREIARDLHIVSTWPEKAVFSLTSRCHWDGVVAPDGSEDPYGLSSILEENRFATEIGQAIASAATHGVAFLATLPGDVSAGDPSVLVLPYSAMTAAALWDRRRRGISAGLLINDADYLGRPTELILLTPQVMVSMAPLGSQGWFVTGHVEHHLGRTPMEALVYRGNLDRPLGRSRLTDGVLSIVDRAVRASMRMDLSSELFTAPGLLLRGVDEATFDKIKRSWSWQLGSVKGLSRDEDGDIPEVDTIPQQSMQPYVDQLRELAQELAGALSLPVSSLGIVQDNPSSADAIYAAREELVTEASDFNDANSYALNRVYRNILMLRDGWLPDDAARISTHWRNPARPSIVSQSDAMIKQIQAIPELGRTDVALEELGYTRQQIARIRAQVEQSRGRDNLDAILRGARGEAGTV
jgi:phage portal protein, SPP1 gp6-like|nr:MAG TPA: PORTAL PROTEIN [Caudoviricetes sp.]